MEYQVDALLHVVPPYLLPSLYALSDLASEVVVHHLWIWNGRLSDTRVLVLVTLTLVEDHLWILSDLLVGTMALVLVSPIVAQVLVRRHAT